MSLATRCPACGTIFRVVQDQLKVSEGWVRCGQCHEVFHGIEALFDLDSDPAVAARRSPRAPSPPAPASGFGAVTSAAPAPHPPAPDFGPPPEPPVAPPTAVAVTQPVFPPRFEPTPPPAPSTGGFAPAGAPASTHTTMVAPPVRRTIAPRFAQRLAEDSARMRGAPVPDLSMPPAETPALVVSAPVEPVAAPVPAPAPPAPAALPVAASAPEPTPAVDLDLGTPPDEAEVPPTEVMELAPTRPMEIEPVGTRAPEPPPPARQPRAIVVPPADTEPPPDEEIVVDDAFDPRLGGSTMPSRLADDDDEADQGPLTLASMLPDASDWPQRPEPRRRRRGKPPETSAAARPAQPEAPAADEAAPGESHDARFLREARRDARWNKPWVRATLGVGLVLLVAGAAAQVAWPLRDTLAARWPATRPAWDALCQQLGCTIEAPRALASLALDGSSLTRTGTEHVLLFSADLHNRGDQEVRMPSFDLTFMDLNGEVVARKVLSPAQIGIAQKSLAPEAELHVHARLQVGTLEASGFQAYLFYP